MKSESANNKETILIFGGNGFIGCELTEYLLDNFDENQYEFILVNRENWEDWDSYERIRKRVKINICLDRKHDSLKTKLNDYLSSENFRFFAIIDLSGYYPSYIQQVLNDIPGSKIRLYIYISTDSVYEVCDTSSAGAHGLKETDSKRPESIDMINEYNKFDDYGNEKLECEELITENFKNKSNTFDFIFLRLPDVIGPRDSTERFWFYQIWLQFIKYLQDHGQKFDIKIPKKFFNEKTSYVYVKDIARTVAHLLRSDIKNEIFNIGFNESFTLPELMKLMASIISPGLENTLNFVITDDNDHTHSFPSVTKGYLDLSKIQNILKFECTDVHYAFEETIRFYDRAFFDFPSKRKRIEKDFRRTILEKEIEKKQFEEFIQLKLKQL